MATNKVEGCFAQFSAKEFERIERAAEALAKGAQPLNTHYVEVVEGLLATTRAQLDALQPAAQVQPPASAGERESVAELIASVDNAPGDLELEGAADALAARYMEDAVSDADSAAIDAYVESDKTFRKGVWANALKRQEDTKVRRKGGKRGLRTGRDTAGTASKTDPETAALLGGVWARFSQGSAVPQGASVTVVRAQRIVKKVLDALGVSDVVRVEVFRNPAEAGVGAPANLKPAGVALGDGRVLVFTDNLASDLDVFRVVFHELFHLGLSKNLAQSEYVQRMLKFKVDPLVAQYVARWKKSTDGVNRKGAMPVNNYEALAVEEALADISEDLATNQVGTREMDSFVRSMVTKLAAFAEAVGLARVAQELRRMTFTQAEKFVTDTIQGVRSQGAVQLRGARFSQGTPLREADLNRQERAEGVPESFSDKWRSTPMGYAIRNMGASWRGNRWMLGWLTLDQLKDRFADFKNVGRATDVWLGMGAQATGLMRPATQLHKQWAAVTRRDRAAAKRLDQLLVGATRAQAWVDGSGEPRADKRNKHLDFNDPAVVKEVAAMRALYLALPKDVQQLYRELTAELTSQFHAKQDALLKRVVDVYADALANVASREELTELARSGRLARSELMQELRPGMTMRDQVELQQFAAAVDTTYIPTGQVPGPYFPLTRRGDYVVVFRSEGHRAVEAHLMDTRKVLDDLLNQQPPTDAEALATFNEQIAAARASVTAARKALAESKGKESEYETRFVDGRAQADDARAALAKARGVPLSAMEPVRLRREFNDRADSVPPGFLAKLEAQLQKELPDSSRKDVASAVRQMVIQSMPERSAFRAELRRMNVAGVEPEDAMYSFVTTSHRNAWTISRLDNLTDLATALNAAAGSDVPDERLVGAELQKRYGDTLVYDGGNALLDAASNLSYLTHLGFSPGYYIQNMLQPWMVSMPVLAGKYGFGATNKALADATVEVVRAMRDTIKQDRTHNNWEMPLDLAMFEGEERQLLEQLTNKGRIDITIRADLGVGTGADRSVAGQVLQKAAEWSSLPAHQVEVVNRVATALAAFRLAKRRGSSYEAAMTEADKVVVQTHVDYSVENAPRFMNPNALGGLGRLTFQFRRYQQAMVFLWGKLLVDTIRHGDKDSARALAYLTGSNLAMAGAAGLPLAAPLGLVASMIASADEDDQERDWIEHFWAGVRNVAGDTVHDLSRKGIPAALGVDMSSRIGMGSILSPIYQMPNAQTGQEWVGGLSATLFGAAGGTVAGWADAIMVAKDNPAMAIQKILPAGFRGVFQSIDREYVSGGLTDRRGNVVIGSDELGGTDFLARVLNLGESTQVSNMYDTRSAMMASEQSRTALRSRLMREYNQARLDRDTAAVAAARKEIDAFNQRNPRAVQILGANLASTYRQEVQRRKELQGGVRVRERNQDLAEFYGAQ